MNPKISIGKYAVGLDEPTYFVADIAANHDGSLGKAIDLINLCAEAGANAAKFQNFAAQTIVSDIGFSKLEGLHSHQSNWSKSVSAVYEDAALPLEWTEKLKEACDHAGIDYFTSPYDLDFVSLLSKYVCAWKLGSGDITWHDMIARLASDGKPLLIATGASTMTEVHSAVAAATRHTNEIILMQCNTNYTASVENFHFIALNVLKTYATEFPDLVLGLSDHTPGHSTVLGAVTLGARVIEKHFTDDITAEGPDHAFAMAPSAWREMVDRTRELEAALGIHEKKVMENELETVVVQRRSVRAKRDFHAGETVGVSDIEYLRPCPTDALPPYDKDKLIGKKLKSDISKGDCFRLSDLL
jgi:sialic acid synthase SpsE